MEFANQLILACGSLLLLAILAGKLSSRIGAPLLLVFLGLGMAAGGEGPGGIEFDDFPTAYSIASVALAIILFDGGLRTSVRTVKKAWAPASLLATIGVVVTAALTGIAVMAFFDMDPMTALLMGTVVASTDAAAVFLLLHQHGMDIREKVSATLELESGANDPMAIFLTATLVTIIGSGMTMDDLTSPQTLMDLGSVLGLAFGVGVTIGLLGGVLLATLINRLVLAPGLYPVLAVAATLALFGASQELGGSGFMTVYLAGIVAGNRRLRADKMIRRFHDGIAWVSQIVLLVMLGLLVTPSTLLPNLVPATMVALALVFVARPVAVFLCLLPSRLTRRERFFVAWVGLRGGVPIYLAIMPVLSGVPGAEQIFSVTFIVVLVSLALQGWSIPWVARRLGVEIPPAPETVSRLEIDIPSNLDRDVVGYSVLEDSPIANRPIKELSFPPRSRILAVLRSGRVVSERILKALKPGDFVLMIAPPEHTLTLDRRFLPDRGKVRRRIALADFVFPGDAPAGPVAMAYEVAVPEGDRDQSLADFMRGQLGDAPSVGDSVRLGAIELVVMEMDGEDMTSVGLRLEPEEPDRIPDLVPDWAHRGWAATQRLLPPRKVKAQGDGGME